MAFNYEKADFLLYLNQVSFLLKKLFFVLTLLKNKPFFPPILYFSMASHKRHGVF